MIQEDILLLTASVLLALDTGTALVPIVLSELNVAAELLVLAPGLNITTGVLRVGGEVVHSGIISALGVHEAFTIASRKADNV